jgi:DNA-binding NarL/FixJ family response regulator
VLVLTTFDLDEYVYDAPQAGASGFLLKDAPPDQLRDAVRRTRRGRRARRVASRPTPHRALPGERAGPDAARRGSTR